MSRAMGARAFLAGAFETTYGTAPASGFLRLPFARDSLGASQRLQESELLGYGRDPLDPVLDEVTADGDVVVPIDAESFGFWLKAALGDPTTTEDTGVYTHVFTSGNWDLPSFSIEKGMPDVPHYPMISGCKVDRLSWTMQRAGLLQATASIIAQGEDDSPTSSQAGTITDYAIDQRFNHFQGAITMDGADLANVVSTEITLANNIDRIETIRSDGLIDGADAGMMAVTGSTVMRFANTTLLDKAVAGTPVAFQFTYSISASASLTIAIPRVFLPKPKREIPGPRGVQVTFEWHAAQQADGSEMLTATLVNEVASY